MRDVVGAVWRSLSLAGWQETPQEEKTCGAYRWARREIRAEARRPSKLALSRPFGGLMEGMRIGVSIWDAVEADGENGAA